MKKRIMLLIFLCILIICPQNVYADKKKTDKENKEVEEQELKEKANKFYNSVTKDGYLYYVISITENRDDTYSLNLYMRENKSGIEIGFYVSPTIIKNLNNTSINYQSYIDDTYVYVIGDANYKSFDDLSVDLFKFSLYKVMQDKNEVFGVVDLSIWNKARAEDELLDAIYKHNHFIFTYRPLKTIQGNYTEEIEGEYIWVLNDGEENGILIEEVNTFIAVLIVITIGVIIIGGGLFVILGGIKLIKNRKRKKNRNMDDGYSNNNLRQNYNPNMYNSQPPHMGNQNNFHQGNNPQNYNNTNYNNANYNPMNPPNSNPYQRLYDKENNNKY